MKKNKMMRLASALLVLTLLTTCIISGTFAKYVTTDSASDTARVAKFGVVASVSGDLFGATYKAVNKGNSITTYDKNGGTVSSADGEFVVAPGTKNGTGLTLSVSGTPEVSTKVTLGGADKHANSDIYLGAGSYGVMVAYDGVVTKENVGDYYILEDGTYKTATMVPDDDTTQLYELHESVKVTETGGYYPLKWKVDNTEYSNVAKVAAALSGKFDNKEFNPNASIELDATVTWEWAFEDANDSTVDGQDTVLGDMIAASGENSGVSYTVVKANDNEGYDTVKYATVDAATDVENDVVVAYTGEKVPSSVSDSGICACLTVSFGASLTVTQVD